MDHCTLGTVPARDDTGGALRDGQHCGRTSGGPSSRCPRVAARQRTWRKRFRPDLFTGTGNFTVPIALPPGRRIADALAPRAASHDAAAPRAGATARARKGIHHPLPAQLVNRLSRFLDHQIANDIMPLAPPSCATTCSVLCRPNNPAQPNEPAPNTRPHWPTGNPQFGDPFPRVFSVMIHETSGWPSYASSNNFRDPSAR